MDEIAEAILALGEGTRLQAIFPVRTQVIERREDTAKASGPAAKTSAESQAAGQSRSPHTETLKARLAELRANGFNRLYQQEQISSSPRPSRCSTSTSPCPSSSCSIASSSAPENRARIVDAAEIAYREGGEVIYEEVPRETTARARTTPAPLFNSLRVQKLPPPWQGARAASLQLQ